MKLQNTSIKKKGRATPKNSAAVVVGGRLYPRGLSLELVDLVSGFLPGGVLLTPVVLSVALADGVTGRGGTVALADDLGTLPVVAEADDLNLHRISPLRLECTVPRLPVAGIPKTNLKDALSIADSGQSVKSKIGLVFNDRKSPKIRAFSGFLSWIKKFSSTKIKIWFEPMFFFGFFCGFERCGSAAFPNFRGGTFSEKCVRTNSRILHQTGKVKEFWFAVSKLSLSHYLNFGY